MLTSETRFETPNASKYLQQLCKHFGHRVEETHTETEGPVELPLGPATMHADDAGLALTVTAADEASLGTAQSVVEDHLKRFAFREEFDKLDWSAPT